MKAVFHKIIAILMSFVVLFSTMSFTIDMHYCGNTLVETALFHKAKGCGMEIDTAITGSECSISKKNCCKEEQIVIKGQNDLKISIDNLSFNQQVFVASFVYSYVSIFENFDENVITFSKYPPPRIVKSIYKLDETYLI